jgi:hypothetical protein
LIFQLQRLKLTSDVLLFLDIAFMFFRAYETNGREVYGLRKIAWKYVKFDFWFQLLTSLPWDRLLAASWGQPREFLRLVRDAALNRQCHCLHSITPPFVHTASSTWPA